MEKNFTESFLRKAWGSEKPIVYKGKKYIVGRMSYGDYFFEPFEARSWGEKSDFHPKTLWLKRVEGNPDLYEVDE